MASELRTDVPESQDLEVRNYSDGFASHVPKYKRRRVWTWVRASQLGAFVRGLKACTREFAAWRSGQPVVMPGVSQLTASLHSLQWHADDLANREKENQQDAPIFLLSTGWRAGSTLLQRILVTDPRLLLWGEPLGEMTIVSTIAETVCNSISARNLQLWKDQHDPSSAELSTSWVANLYPSGSDFRSGLRSLFDHWLREPARERGFARWGFKDVRLGSTEACLLRWLYPNGKFVIITRDPYDSYRSLADSGWGEVYYRYPDVSVDSAAAFARHWNRLAVSWAQLPAGFPSVHIKYEHLIGGKVDFRELERWLGLEIRESVALKASVGGTAKRAQLSWYERLIISREAAEGMRALGYSK
jgi:hypothetical protein